LLLKNWEIQLVRLSDDGLVISHRTAGLNELSPKGCPELPTPIVFSKNAIDIPLGLRVAISLATGNATRSDHYENKLVDCSNLKQWIGRYLQGP
jgi:hypothetical protein